jgi:uncharacterized protein
MPRSSGDEAKPDFKSLKEQVDNGSEDPNVLYNLARCYSRGDGVDKNPEEAVNLYREASARRHAKAKFYLAVAYETGNGIDQDPAKAMKHYKRSAELGYEKAQAGYDDLAQKVKEFRECQDAVVEHPKNLDVLYDMAQFYARGHGVAKDLEKAVGLYEQAVELGHVKAGKALGKAQNSLGLAYEKGQGVRQDLTQALRSYGRSAEQGYPEGQYNAGRLWETVGIGNPNVGKAIRYYQSAANQKNDNRIADLAKQRLKVIDPDYRSQAAAQAAEAEAKAAADLALASKRNKALRSNAGRSESPNEPDEKMAAANEPKLLNWGENDKLLPAVSHRKIKSEWSERVSKVADRKFVPPGAGEPIIIPFEKTRDRQTQEPTTSKENCEAFIKSNRKFFKTNGFKAEVRTYGEEVAGGKGMHCVEIKCPDKKSEEVFKQIQTEAAHSKIQQSRAIG